MIFPPHLAVKEKNFWNHVLCKSLLSLELLTFILMCCDVDVGITGTISSSGENKWNATARLSQILIIKIKATVSNLIFEGRNGRRMTNSAFSGMFG